MYDMPVCLYIFLFIFSIRRLGPPSDIYSGRKFHKMDMKEQLSKITTSFRQFWEAQDRKRRVAYIGIVVAIVLIAVIIAIILNKKDYVILYEGLETSEAAEIVELVKESGVDATLKSDGSILVPAGTENSVAMNMAMQGYPKSNLDYSTYTENVGMFTTEAQEREYKRIALENHMSAIVGSLEGVERATVTYSIPKQERTVITNLRQYPSATVVVYLKKDVKLTNEQIDGIIHLIKHSYVDMQEENITILDGYGIPQVIEEYTVDVVADVTRKLAFKTSLENSIRDKVLGLLTPIYGDDGVSVAVNMVLNFDKRVSENTDYGAEPGTTTGVLQHGDATEASGGVTAAGGVVGVETNADDTYPTGDTDGAGAWTENSISNTYLVDTYKEQIEKADYTIDGLSISAVIYTDYISDAQLLSLQSAVANAGGVNPEVAADVVTVTNFAKFDDGLGEQTVPTYLFGLTFNQLIVAAAILLILLIVVIVVLIITSRSARTKRQKFEQKIIEATSADLGENGDEIVDTFTIDLDGRRIEVPSLMDEQEDTKELIIRKEISEFAKNSPEIVAQLLKSWMKEGEE